MKTQSSLDYFINFNNPPKQLKVVIILSHILTYILMKFEINLSIKSP